MRWVVLLAALSLGCGPSVAGLVARKEYRAAICSAREKELVSRALFEDTKPAIHLQTLGDAQLGTEVASKARVVRLIMDTARIPVDAMRVSVTTSPAILTWASIETFAELTGETLPPVERRTTVPNVLANMVAVFFTAGLWLLTDPFSPRTYRVEPPPEAYRRHAPRAFGLAQATTADASCDGTARCTMYFVLPRTVERPLLLNFAFEYAVRRPDHDEHASGPRSEAQCFAKHSAHVSIGTLDELPAWTKATFGDRPRPLSELAR